MRNSVALFSRKGCHLCEQAEDLVAIYFPRCQVLNVDLDESHKQLYGIRVPVLVVGGEVSLEGKFSEADVVRLAQSLKDQAEHHDDSGHE